MHRPDFATEHVPGQRATRLQMYRLAKNGTRDRSQPPRRPPTLAWIQSEDADKMEFAWSRKYLAAMVGMLAAILAQFDFRFHPPDGRAHENVLQRPPLYTKIDRPCRINPVNKNATETGKVNQACRNSVIINNTDSSGIMRHRDDRPPLLINRGTSVPPACSSSSRSIMIPHSTIPAFTLWTLTAIGISQFGKLPMADAQTPPNIIVFLVDDMGIMDTSVPFLAVEKNRVGRHPLNEFYRTPNMQRLADAGVRFNQFSAMSVCSPTRISLMTGQNAARHRTTTWINPDQNNAGPQGPPQWNWHGLKPGDVTLAAVLKGHGYRTIHVGKAHFAPRATPGEDPATLGFDINIAGASFGAPGSYYAKNHFGALGKRNHHAVPHLENYHGSETFLTEALTLEAKAQITNSANDNQPFFLHLSHYAVHAPFESDPRFAAHYADSEKPNPAKAFATLVEGMDKSLGDILDHLNTLGIADNTFIIFLGDNGSDAPLGHEHAIACAAPLRGKKGSHYEGGTRVPFIAAWAKPNNQSAIQQRIAILGGAIQSQPANVCDVFPTVLAVANCAPPQEHPIDGDSLVSLFNGKTDESRDSSFLMHFPHAPHRSNYWSSLRDGDWKVIYHYFPANDSSHGHYQLFNLAADPSESNDLASTHPEPLRRMMNRLIEKLSEYGAIYPVDAESKVVVQPIVPTADITGESR